MFIDAFLLFQNPFSSVRTVSLIKNNVEILKCFKVNLQYGIVIQRVVTIHELPSLQLSRIMNLKIEFAKN